MNGQSSFNDGELNLDQVGLAAERRPSGGVVFSVDQTPDATRLKSLLAEVSEYRKKLESAAATVAAEARQQSRARADSIAQPLAPGSLFSGMATGIGSTENDFVLVEITGLSTSTQRVSTVLRNDGGWTDARSFHGTSTIDAYGTAKVVLQITASGGIASAGLRLDDAPGLLDDAHLAVRSQGGDESRNWALRRIDPAAAAAVKTDLQQAVTRAPAATKPGSIYVGTATPKDTRTAERLVLHFTDQAANGSLLQASLESTTPPVQRRPFHGTITGNTYRVGNTPVLLWVEGR